MMKGDEENKAAVTLNAAAISGDTLSVNLDRMADEGRITQGDKALIVWFHTECRGKAMSLDEMGALIGYTSTTVSRLFNGRYEGSVEQVVAAIRRYKHISDERGRMTRPDFIETTVWNEIRKTCDLALFNQMPGMVMGVPQIGKTYSLLEYQRRSEYTVRYVRMPAAPGFRSAMEAVADACRVTTRCTTEQLRRRVKKSLDNQTLLVIDELHQLAISTGRHSAMKIMEWLREVYDESRCGLIVCGTQSLDTDLIQGELRDWLEQFKERCIRRLVLPKAMPDGDIRLVAKTYGLPPPEGDVMAALRGIRMNRYAALLMLAGNVAKKRGQDLGWEHFMAAWKTVGISG